MAQYAQGFVVTPSTAAAVNVECGFYPTFVKVADLTDGTEIIEASLQKLIAFDGGGGTGKEIIAGDTVQGGTGAWTARVLDVIRISGSWEDGDFDGLLVIEPGTLTSGTITDNETINVQKQKGGPFLSDYGTVDGTGVTDTLNIAAAVAAATGTSAITPYAGTSGDNSRGFTLGSAVGGTSKVLHWQAWGDGVG